MRSAGTHLPLALARLLPGTQTPHWRRGGQEARTMRTDVPLSRMPEQGAGPARTPGDAADLLPFGENKPALG